jgi:rod shape-determining protein MreD
VKQGIAMLALGLLALIVQGALATIAPPPFTPDLALLVVLCIGLRWRGLTAGLCLAAALGFCADLLSGSLMGQHALLRLLAFSSAFFAGRQLNLKGSLPLVVFAFVVTVVYGLALLTVSTFFIGAGELAVRWVADLILHAGVNAIVAPWVYTAVGRVSGWIGEGEVSGRSLHIDPHGRPA